MPTNLFDDTYLTVVDPDKDYYAELVGPGKKYADQKAFGRSRVEADIHIARIEDEQKRLRAELANRIEYEDFLNQLKSIPLTGSAITPPSEPPKDLTGFKQEDIERLLDMKLQQREQERTAEQNLNIVDRKLTEVYGQQYAQHLKRQAAELGVSESFIRNVASANPKALYRLLGIEEKTNKDNAFQPPLKNEFSFASGLPSGDKRGDSYYEEIRKKDPNKFFSAKIQNEIFDRIKEIGLEAFNAS